MSMGIALAEQGYVPDAIVRLAIRRLLKKRLLQDRARRTPEGKAELIKEMCQGPVAINTGDANQQHYEVPTGFFQLMLGSRMKYSCASFDDERGAERSRRKHAGALLFKGRTGRRTEHSRVGLWLGFVVALLGRALSF